MKIRYFVAISISKESVEEMRTFYKNNFLSEMPVRNVHLTLVAPFFIKEGKRELELREIVNKIEVYPFVAQVTGLDFFEQKGRKILFAKVEPEIELKELAEKCGIALKELIEMDTSPYSGAKVPSFKAHITLDYDFREIIPDVFPKTSFRVEKLVIYKEENGVWREL